MRTVHCVRLVGLALALGLSNPGMGEVGDPAAGESKAATCTGCHGVNGNSVNPIWPKLAGQHPDYTIKQLQDFKAGRRQNASMSPMAAPLSEQDMRDLAAYYAAQNIEPGGADPALVELGEKIYRGGNTATGVAACTGCHGPAGLGNPAAAFPALGGQHQAYVVSQLEAFQAGERSNDPSRMMRHIAEPMTAREIEAVASFIEGLQP